MNDQEKPDGTDTSSQVYYERPKGLRGLYSHPLTQVCPYIFFFLIGDESEATQVTILGLVCFMCPGMS